jgi:hypothetical protein
MDTGGEEHSEDEFPPQLAQQPQPHPSESHIEPTPRAHPAGRPGPVLPTPGPQVAAAAHTAPNPTQIPAAGQMGTRPLASTTTPDAGTHHLAGTRGKPLPTSVDVHHFFHKIKNEDTICSSCQ